MSELKVSELYEQDFCLWAEQIAQLLRSGHFSEIDLENLIDEVQDMSRSQKRALLSNLRVIILHLLKYKYQPDNRSNSWLSSIREHRTRIEDSFRDSPSLRVYIQEMFTICYENARKQAVDETSLPLDVFPEQAPFTLSECLNEDFLSE
jgi:predicted DNA-binding ribbon-helix-helix protein